MITQKKDTEDVLHALRRIVPRIPPEQGHVHVYYEGGSCYSWKEILVAVEHGTDMGKRYVKTVVQTARTKKQSLLQYLEGTDYTLRFLPSMRNSSRRKGRR